MSSQNLIANELLAFIQHAIDTMDEVSILQICKSNFKEEEISSGKRLLFEVTGKLEEMPSRRRDGTEKSIQDIITLLKVTDPDDVPAFVAKELHRLPPVTFDHVDVTRLLKDITSLQTSLVEVKSKLAASENTIEDLRAEVLSLRNTVSASRSPLSATNVNTRRGAAQQNASVSSFESPHMDVSSPARIDENASRHSVDRPARAIETTSQVDRIAHVGSPIPKRAYAAIVTEGKPAESQKQQAKAGKQSRSISNKKLKQQQTDEDGFIKVEKKMKKKPQKSQNQCGSALAGPNMLLRPAIPTTLLYVSRLHYSTKVEEVMEYLRVKTSWNLRVEMLEPRHETNFKSFVVRVPTHYLERFLKDEFWPKGVVYRRFRGLLRGTSQRNTTPPLRVQ